MTLQLTPLSVLTPTVTKVAIRYQFTATVRIVRLLSSNKLNCSLDCTRLMTVSVSVSFCLCKIDRLYVLK